MAEKEEKKKELDRLQIANLNRLNKTNSMLSSKNNWFYLAIILINVVTLVVAWLIESNSKGVATGVFSSFDYRYLYLLAVSLLILVLLKCVPDYIFLYKKTRSRRFASVLVGNIESQYYRTLTFRTDRTDSLYVENLKVSKVNDNTAKEMVNTTRVASKLSEVIYSLVIIVLGTIFVFSSTKVFLYVFALIGFVLSLMYVLVVLYFEKFKAKYLIVIGNLCKLLYRLKLVKDYEKLYNALVVKLMQYGSVFKNNKLYMLCQIISGVLIKFIVQLIIFFLVCVFNIASWEILLEVLFNCTILDIIIGMIPMPQGTLVYELLFLALFRAVFIDGYILYGMIVYRVIRYFLIQIVFGIAYVVGIRKSLKVVSSQIDAEIETII